MNYERRALGVEQGIRAIPERYVRREQGDPCASVLADLEVWKIPCVRAFRVLGPMLFRLRIEMRPRRSEIRCVALADGVDVKRMRPRRKI